MVKTIEELPHITNQQCSHIRILENRTKHLRLEDFKLPNDEAKVLREELNNYNCVVVLQCGGFGIRSRKITPKTVFPLEDNRQTEFTPPVSSPQESLHQLINGERPLSNILKDLPAEMPIFCHVLQHQQPQFEDFLNGFGGFGHHIDYLIQNETQIFHKHGNIYVPMGYPHNGKIITGTDGPGTFARRFGNYRDLDFPSVPKYCIVMDGAKFGIALEDVASALLQLRESSDIDVVVFSRPITNEGRKKEKQKLKERKELNDSSIHTRYAYARTKPMTVAEHPGEVSEDAVMNGTPLGGIYVMRLENYLQGITGKQGELAPVLSGNALWTGYAPYLKITMALEGYNCSGDERKPGLKFSLYDPSFYISGLKRPEDINEYFKKKDRGGFGYRRW